MGVYFSQTSVINFCPGFSYCPYYWGVRYSRVSARGQLSFKKRISICRSENNIGVFSVFVLISLRRRRNLTTVSNVCEAAPISLFWAANALNELPEVRFEFPFILIGKSTIAF